MNERIKELAKQASDAVAGTGFTMTKYDEKLAELIVKECCDLMQGFTFEEIATKVIKKNFGVEE